MGHRWGRDAHWPLLVAINTHRYRSKRMRIKRAEKERLRQETLAEAEAFKEGGAEAVLQLKERRAAKGKGKGKPKKSCAGGSALSSAGAAPGQFQWTGTFDEARWQGHVLVLYNGWWTSQWGSNWYRLQGPDPQHNAWCNKHWWERM